MKSINRIKILKELKDFIVPPGNDEYLQLESNLLSEGCREKLIVWENDNSLVLIDGHNRFKICSKHKISYEIEKRSFKSLDDVKKWMLQNQLGRRNLNPDQLSYYRGLKYLSSKKQKGGYSNVESKGHIEPSTSEVLSKEFKVSESTIKRDSKFAEALNIVGISNSKLKNEILSGKVKVKKSDLQVLLKDEDLKDMIILNESDLHHKIQLVKNELLSSIESDLKKIERDKEQEKKAEIAEDIATGLEPLFLKQEDRLRKIKGRIISAINRAIENKDLESIGVLKSLIDKLEFELHSDFD